MLTHYIIVRRDLPTAVQCAQVAHAAGESFVAWAIARTVAGKSVAWPSNLPMEFETDRDELSVDTREPSDDPSETRAVILGARSHGRLITLGNKLREANVPHVQILENGGPFAGEYTAIGLLPVEEVSGTVQALLRDYQLLPSAGLAGELVGDEP
jgi:hypothetical protein